jgi:hypothetical protein
MSQPSPALPKSVPRQLCLIWDSEVCERDGKREVVARRPLDHVSTKQAAKLLGVTEWTISRLYRLGFLMGFKPGAVVLKRRDGKPSNAPLRIYAESLLAYKARQDGAGCSSYY